MLSLKFMSTGILLLLLSFISNSSETRIQPTQIKNLVTFGDSYTDVDSGSNGGTAWPVYAAGYASVSLFSFARAGATCSNNITFRPSPSVFESQLPTYFQSNASKLDPNETLYTLWIGTNDLGENALLTGSDNASLVDVTACMVNWVTTLYNCGAQNFLFQNMIPLENVILFAPNSYPNPYWSLERNTTEWSAFMKELVLSGNALTKLMLQALARSLKHAHIAIFDSHSLFADMYSCPALYLNGTAPLNVTGAVRACVLQLNDPDGPESCTIATGTDKDSFLWYDEVHPSEQAGRVVAQEIAQVIEGQENEWTTWLC